MMHGGWTQLYAARLVQRDLPLPLPFDQRTTALLPPLEPAPCPAVRMTWNVWPQSRLEAAKCVIPFCALYTPAKQTSQLQVRRRRCCRQLLGQRGKQKWHTTAGATAHRIVGQQQQCSPFKAAVDAHHSSVDG